MIRQYNENSTSDVQWLQTTLADCQRKLAGCQRELAANKTSAHQLHTAISKQMDLNNQLQTALVRVVGVQNGRSNISEGRHQVDHVHLLNQLGQMNVHWSSCLPARENAN